MATPKTLYELFRLPDRRVVATSHNRKSLERRQATEEKDHPSYHYYTRKQKRK